MNVLCAVVATAGVAAVGGAFFKSLFAPKAKRVDCITYGDLLFVLYDSGVKAALAANPALRLAARKLGVTAEGKEMTQVNVEWYDSGARRFKPMSPPWSRVSEQIDEELAAKFGPSSVIFVGE